MRSDEDGVLSKLGRGLVIMAVGGISLYRMAISPILPKACRFEPTCSEYALRALRRHGILKGSTLAVRRILRCHPLGGSGIDPVP